MKTFVLTVSRVFPTTHKRKGEPTFFIQKIFTGQDMLVPCQYCTSQSICTAESPCIARSMNFSPKIHTIRSNYDLWANRIKQIQEGKAILSIRYWSGKPYNSKQVEICKLDKDSEIGVQRLEFYHSVNFPRIAFDESRMAVIPVTLAKNDGLSIEDFREWFKKADLSKPMAILHFTSFRY